MRAMPMSTPSLLTQAGRPDGQWHGAMNTFGGFQLIQLIAELFPRPLSLAIWLS